MLQSFLLVWLDADFDESKDHYNKSIQDLQRIAATIITFTDADQCVDFLSDIEDEKVFMIVSVALGQNIVPEIQALPQLHSIYVFCDNQSIHQQWAKTIPKVKGVYTQIEPICEALPIDQKNCDQNMISISFDRIDPLFISLPKFCAGANGTDVLNIPITKAGDSTSANFIAAGTYYYGCNYHPGMGATIIVFPSSTGSSSSSANSLTGSSSMLVSNARMGVGHQ
ncbi:unnamed protein product [Rotaria sordida]|uniref:Uncharacterized protein n=2 Tax=Rotaria sordida TaxID=392033 RepID=A0A814IUK9_9BILA|nr:unnamed protein product [Rotaria sordida]